jgi:hypothetical protein
MSQRILSPYFLFDSSRGVLLGRLVLLLLAAAAVGGRLPRGLLMDDEFRIAIVLVPLEAGEVGVLEFIVGLLEF